MSMKVKQTVWMLFLVLMMLAVSFSSVLAQEEAEAVAEGAGVGPGWMIAIIGTGALVILGLGAAMSAQQADEQQTD